MSAEKLRPSWFHGFQIIPNAAPKLATAGFFNTL
jgi:hypothetical protein